MSTYEIYILQGERWLLESGFEPDQRTLALAEVRMILKRDPTICLKLVEEIVSNNGRTANETIIFKSAGLVAKEESEAREIRSLYLVKERIAGDWVELSRHGTRASAVGAASRRVLKARGKVFVKAAKVAQNSAGLLIEQEIVYRSPDLATRGAKGATPSPFRQEALDLLRNPMLWAGSMARVDRSSWSLVGVSFICLFLFLGLAQLVETRSAVHFSPFIKIMAVSVVSYVIVLVGYQGRRYLALGTLFSGARRDPPADGPAGGPAGGDNHPGHPGPESLPPDPPVAEELLPRISAFMDSCVGALRNREVDPTADQKRRLAVIMMGACRALSSSPADIRVAMDDVLHHLGLEEPLIAFTDEFMARLSGPARAHLLSLGAGLLDRLDVDQLIDTLDNSRESYLPAPPANALIPPAPPCYHAALFQPAEWAFPPADSPLSGTTESLPESLTRPGVRADHGDGKALVEAVMKHCFPAERAVETPPGFVLIHSGTPDALAGLPALAVRVAALRRSEVVLMTDAAYNRIDDLAARIERIGVIEDGPAIFALSPLQPVTAPAPPPRAARLLRVQSAR